MQLDRYKSTEKRSRVIMMHRLIKTRLLQRVAPYDKSPQLGRTRHQSSTYSTTPSTYYCSSANIAAAPGIVCPMKYLGTRHYHDYKCKCIPLRKLSILLPSSADSGPLPSPPHPLRINIIVGHLPVNPRTMPGGLSLEYLRT